MEVGDIDFEILQHLQQAPSKKYLKKVIEYCFLIRNKIYSFQEFYQTPVAEQFYQDLNLTESQSHQMLISLVKLIELSAQQNFNDIEKIFPPEFDEQLKTLLSDQLGSFSNEWTTNINQRICQADRLVDVDWRIDVQLAASHKDNRQNMPIVFMQLEMLGNQNDSKNLNFQMNTQELSGFFNNLKKIKDQLNSLVRK